MMHCYYCTGSSYEDCKKNKKFDEVNDTYACVQYHMRFDNGSVKMDAFSKTVVDQRACEQLSKGNLTEECYHPFYECKAKCCYEDYCNKENILDTTDQDSSSRKAVYISDGVVAMGLLLGVSLSAFSVN